MPRITLQGVTTTRGTYMGEEGTGYLFLLPGQDPADGDFSAATCGRLQGHDFAAAGTLDRRLRVGESESGEALAYLAEGEALGREENYRLGGPQGWTAQECHYAGLLDIDGIPSRTHDAHDV